MSDEERQTEIALLNAKAILQDLNGQNDRIAVLDDMVVKLQMQVAMMKTDMDALIHRLDLMLVDRVGTGSTSGDHD